VLVVEKKPIPSDEEENDDDLTGVCRLPSEPENG
jgi:hypothetical protein